MACSCPHRHGINLLIAVNEAVPHVSHITPRNRGGFFLNVVRNMPNRFINDLKIPHDSVYRHPIRLEVLVG